MRAADSSEASSGLKRQAEPQTFRESLVGTWEWKGKERHGAVPWWLQEIEYVAIYPYCDLRQVPRSGREAYGEAVFKSREGALLFLPETGGLMRVWPDRLFFGSAVGWMFGYKLSLDAGQEKLSLSWTNDVEEGSFEVKLTRLSKVPREHLRPPSAIRESHFPDWKQHWDRYMKTAGSIRRETDSTQTR